MNMDAYATAPAPNGQHWLTIKVKVKANQEIAPNNIDPESHPDGVGSDPVSLTSAEELSNWTGNVTNDGGGGAIIEERKGVLYYTFLKDAEITYKRHKSTRE
jgi:hypothetical protein